MPHRNPISLDVGPCATLACLLEVTAPKPGNVHRGADFAETTLNDHVAGAVAIGPAMENAGSRGVGPAVLDAIRATRKVTRSNTNLGTVLLLAPLAAAAKDEDWPVGVSRVVSRLTPEDAASVYEAIRLAEPGGLGETADMDVAGEPPQDVLTAMAAAAERDLVARQYINHFEQVLQEVTPAIAAGVEAGFTLPLAVVHVQMQLMSRFPDSLIARKCGRETAEHSAALARAVLQSGTPGKNSYHEALADLDFWLRSDGHRRNPGTTADLIAAGLFVGLCDGRIAPPFG